MSSVRLSGEDGVKELNVVGNIIWLLEDKVHRETEGLTVDEQEDLETKEGVHESNLYFKMIDWIKRGKVCRLFRLENGVNKG